MYDTDVKTEHQIPVSAGIPPIVKISTLAGLLVVFLILGIVIWTASQGHVWPAEDSLKIKLK
jgi:cytosine/uracil/thiamine/allantoin permease